MAIEKFMSCPAAKELWEKCTKKRPSKKIEIKCLESDSAPFPGATAAFNPDNNKIEIYAAQRSVGQVVSYILFELLRACDWDQQQKIYDDCTAGNLSKADFMRKQEELGFKYIATWLRPGGYDCHTGRDVARPRSAGNRSSRARPPG